MCIVNTGGLCRIAAPTHKYHEHRCDWGLAMVRGSSELTPPEGYEGGNDTGRQPRLLTKFPERPPDRRRCPAAATARPENTQTVLRLVNYGSHLPTVNSHDCGSPITELKSWNRAVPCRVRQGFSAASGESGVPLSGLQVCVG